MISGESQFDSNANRLNRKSWHLLEDYLADESADSVLIDALMDYAEREAIEHKLRNLQSGHGRVDEEQVAVGSFYQSRIKKEQTRLAEKEKRIKEKMEGPNSEIYSKIYQPDTIVTKYWNAFVIENGFEEDLSATESENERFITQLIDDLDTIMIFKLS